MDKIILPVGDPTIKPPVQTPTLTDLVIGTETFKINADGNAVDDKGTVLKTKAELEVLKAGANKPPELTPEEKAKKEKEEEVGKTLTEGREIEIDDKKYKVNKEGSLVDEAGKVIKTKAELVNMIIEQEQSAEPDYISEIQKATNLIINDSTGKPVTYENSLPGLTQYVQDSFAEGRKIGASDYEKQLFERYPILSSVIEHLTINGNLDNYKQDVDYSKITLGEDEAQHIDVFTRAKKLQGLPDNEIQDMIKMYKEDKKMKSAAEVALTFLKNKQTTDQTARANAIKEAKDAEEAQRTAYWKEIDKTIAAKQLIVGDKKFNLPEVIKVKEADGKVVSRTLKDFRDYIEKPLNFNVEGEIYTMTQYEYDKAIEDNKRTPHHDLFDAYRMFTKYDDTQLINANVNSNVVKEVLKLKTKAGGGAGSSDNKGGKIKLPVS